MKFPELSREGTNAHTSALQRRDAARAEQHVRREVCAAAEGTSEERAATSDLAAADEQLTAREAWVSWVERGY